MRFKQDWIDFKAFHDWHVWLKLETAELEVWHIGECPVQSVLYGTDIYKFKDYEYLGEL